MVRGHISKQTGSNIIKILRALKESQADGEEFLTINKIAKRTGIHKWSVSRILDLYMPYVNTRIIEELEMLGLHAKLVTLSKPGITEDQALRYLNVRI